LQAVVAVRVSKSPDSQHSTIEMSAAKKKPKRERERASVVIAEKYFRTNGRIATGRKHHKCLVDGESESFVCRSP
jgi:hypothetical protein